MYRRYMVATKCLIPCIIVIIGAGRQVIMRTDSKLIPEYEHYSATLITLLDMSQICLSPHTSPPYPKPKYNP